MMRTFRERAIVLRTYKLGEADRIIVFLGEGSGQFRAVAKGIRRTTSKFGARLQPFNLVDVQCYRGRGDLHTVTGAETLSAYSSSIASRYETFTNAKLVIEGAQRVTEGHDLPDRDQFALLHGALHALASTSHPPALAATSYLLRLAAIEGWRPALDHCANCVQPGWHHSFSLAAGGALCAECAGVDAVPVAGPTLELMEALIQGNWDRASSLPHENWSTAMDLGGAWVQWQVEQRLRSLPFASVIDGCGVGSDAGEGRRERREAHA